MKLHHLPLLMVLSFHPGPATLAQVDQGTPAKVDAADPTTLAPMTEQQKATMLKLANIQKHFGKELNSPGVELSLKETGRAHQADRTLVTYNLYAQGFPEGSVFTLVIFQLDSSVQQVMNGVTLDKNGMAICAGREGTCKSDQPNDPIDLAIFAGKGEPKRFALVTADKSKKGAISVIPFPNSTTDNGCHLESVIGTPNGELTFIQASGFDPGEELIMSGKSYDEEHRDVVKAAPDGSYFATLLPAVKGKKSGKTVLELKSKKCAPKITFSWGEGAYQLQ